MTDRKNAACPNCCPNIEGAAIFRSEAVWSDDCEIIGRQWVCSNCGHSMPHKTRRAFTPGVATKAQLRTIEQLKTSLPSSYAPEKHEWKKWETDVTEYGVVWLTAEYGMIGDEGTLAASIARDYWHIAVGPRGKLDKKTKPNWDR